MWESYSRILGDGCSKMCFQKQTIEKKEQSDYNMFYTLANARAGHHKMIFLDIYFCQAVQKTLHCEY